MERRAEIGRVRWPELLRRANQCRACCTEWVQTRICFDTFERNLVSGCAPQRVVVERVGGGELVLLVSADTSSQEPSRTGGSFFAEASDAIHDGARLDRRGAE